MQIFPVIRESVKRCGVALFVPALGLFSGDGFGQSYPDKPIRWIIVSGAGGGVDVLSRTIAPKLSENLGQPLVTGLLSGEVQFAGLPMLTVKPLIDAGKLKALAMTGAKNSNDE